MHQGIPLRKNKNAFNGVIQSPALPEFIHHYQVREDIIAPADARYRVYKDQRLVAYYSGDFSKTELDQLNGETVRTDRHQRNTLYKAIDVGSCCSDHPHAEVEALIEGGKVIELRILEGETVKETIRFSRIYKISGDDGSIKISHDAFSVALRLMPELFQRGKRVTITHFQLSPKGHITFGGRKRPWTTFRDHPNADATLEIEDWQLAEARIHDEQGKEIDKTHFAPPMFRSKNAVVEMLNSRK